jgi:hypothetical protein
VGGVAVRRGTLGSPNLASLGSESLVQSIEDVTADSFSCRVHRDESRGVTYVEGTQGATDN